MFIVSYKNKVKVTTGILVVYFINKKKIRLLEEEKYSKTKKENYY